MNTQASAREVEKQHNSISMQRGPPITNFDPLFLPPPQQTTPTCLSFPSPPVLSRKRGAQMATAAQAPATPTTTDPIQSWLARRGAVAQLHADHLDARLPGSSAPTSHEPHVKAQSLRRNATNRANSRHSTGPRTEPGKQRSSQNALRHGLTARTAVLPTEDHETYQRHIQQFLDEYAPATPTETQLVHEIANTAWRLNRIPLLEAALLSPNPNPQSPIPQAALIQQLATLGLHGSRLSRQFQKAIDQLRYMQEERLRLERRQLTEAVEIMIRHQRKELPWEPSDDGFVFSKEQIERHARKLMRQNPPFFSPNHRGQADPPSTGVTI
jgi:hypothetical protein